MMCMYGNKFHKVVVNGAITLRMQNWRVRLRVEKWNHSSGCNMKFSSDYFHVKQVSSDLQNVHLLT